MAKTRAGSGDQPSRPAAKSLMGVAGVTDRERRDHRLADLLGEIEVHLGHEGGQDVRSVGPPLEALALPENLQRAGAEYTIHVTDVSGGPDVST
jgi:hypothetical protein